MEVKKEQSNNDTIGFVKDISVVETKEFKQEIYIDSSTLMDDTTSSAFYMPKPEKPLVCCSKSDH